MDELTPKQRAFAEAYIQCGNATLAAKEAGYSGTENALGVIGHRNLRKAKIVKVIRELRMARAKEDVMDLDETLALLSRIGRDTSQETRDRINALKSLQAFHERTRANADDDTNRGQRDEQLTRSALKKMGMPSYRSN